MHHRNLTSVRKHAHAALVTILAVVLGLSLAAAPTAAWAADPGAPTAYDDSGTAYSGSPATFYLMAFDAEGDDVTFQVVSAPTNGTLGTMGTPDCLGGDCSVSLEYTPSAGATSDSFTFTATDTGGHVSDPATFTVTVDPGTPTALDDSTTVGQGTATPLTLYGSDPNGDPLTFEIVDPPTQGHLGAIGSPQCDAGDCNATVTYTPDSGTTADSFTFRVTDDHANQSAPATVDLTVADLTVPTASSDYVEAGKDSTTLVSLFGTDPADLPLTFAIVTQPTHGTLTSPTTADCSGYGCQSSVEYTTAGYVGPDSFTFTVSNGTKTSEPATIDLDVVTAPCAGASITNGTVLLGVNCVGDLNVGNDGLKYVATGNDSTSAGCPCEGWGVADSTSGVSGWANRSSGDSNNLNQISFDKTASTAVSVVDIGSTFRVTHDYHPSTASTNAYEVTVTVKNVSATATHLRYRRVMDWDVEPTPFEEYVTMVKGTSPNVVFTSDDGFATSDALAGPSDRGNTGSFTDKGPDDHGALFDFDFGELAAGDSYTFKTYYGAADTETHALNALNAVNAETFSLGEPSTPDGPTLGTPNTFFFAFAGVGGGAVLAPSAVDDDLAAASGVATPVDVLANDSDPNGDPLTVTDHGAAGHGTVTCTASGCSYTSTAGYSGPDSFTYTISDGQGGTASATVHVTVSAANHPPVAVDDGVTTPEDTATTFDVRGNDTDADGDTLTVTVATPPSHGTVSCSTTCLYTPTANYSGPDAFTYTVSDGHGGTSAAATVTISVTPVNDAPVAVDDSATTPEDTPTVIDVLANDSDVDNGTLSVVLGTAPTKGTVDCSAGTCTYTPNANATGTDTFTYRASDGSLNSTLATVTVTITPVNDAPVAIDDNATATTAVAQAIDVRGNDTDVDGDTLAVTAHGNAAHGTVDCTATGCTYTSDAGYVGNDSFTYTVSDGHGGTDTATVTVAVSRGNAAPVAHDDTLSLAEDTPTPVNVLGNDTDSDGDTLSVTGKTNGTHGTVSCTAAGACTYTPAANYVGPDTFTYTVSDGHGGTATATVAVTVTPVNDLPSAAADALTVNAGSSGNVSVLGNDSDPDGDALTVASETDGAHGTVTCTAAGVCTYTPAAGYVGSDEFTYVASDGHGGTATGHVAVTVRSVACRPAAPSIGTASPGAKRGRVTAIARWSAPTNACAAPITGYVVTALKLNRRGTVIVRRVVVVGPGARSVEMKLPGRRRWTFTVAAVNAVGTGPASARSNIVVAR